jgi:alginate O-acetyltransferase complex protein AlgI
VTGLSETSAGNAGRRVFRTVLTVVLVTVGWVLFRAQSFGDARDVLAAMTGFGGGFGAFASSAAWPWVAVAVWLGAEIAIERGWSWGFERVPIALQATCGATLLLALEVFSWPGTSEPFVYFKF